MSTYYVIEQADGVYRRVAHPGYLDTNGDLAGHNILAERGYYLATDVTPQIDSRYQVALPKTSDQWEFDHTAKTCVVTYTVEPLQDAFATYKAKVKRLIDGWVAQKNVEGVSVTTSDATTHTIQTRHVRDNLNLLSVHSKAVARQSRGDTTVCVLRTKENVTLQLPPAEMVTVLENVFDTIEGIYQQGWQAKADLEQVNEGTDLVVALDSIDSVYTALQAA